MKSNLLIYPFHKLRSKKIIIYSFFVFLFQANLIQLVVASEHDRTNCLSSLKDSNAKIASCSKALKQNPKDDSLWYNRGLSLSSKGRTDEAIADLTKAIEINPTNAQAYYNRSEMLWLRWKKTGSSWDFTTASEDSVRYSELTSSREDKPRPARRSASSEYSTISSEAQSLAEQNRNQYIIISALAALVVSGTLISIYQKKKINQPNTPPIDLILSASEDSIRQPDGKISQRENINNLADRLERLVQLLNKGVLTEEEFEKEKKILLNHNDNIQ